MADPLAVAAVHDSSVPGLFAWVNELARDTGWLHAPVLAFANYGVALFAVLLLTGWWVARAGSPRVMAASLWAGAGTLLAVAVNQPLVNGIHETRPYAAHPSILLLAHRSTDFSFPSDHAVMAGAVATGLWLVSRRLAAIATVMAVLMVFARVYIGAHYPQDVLAGLGLGAGTVVVGWFLVRGRLSQIIQRLRRTPIGRLLVSAPQRPALTR